MIVEQILCVLRDLISQSYITLIRRAVERFTESS